MRKIVLGVAGILAVGLASPAYAQAAHAAAPAGKVVAASCGKVTANRPTVQKKKVFASGGVSDSCKGWSKYCVTLEQVVIVYPEPPITLFAERSCTNLTTGVISGTSTKAAGCGGTAYFTLVQVYKGSSVVKEQKADKGVFCAP